MLKYSVVIPCFNCENTISKTLESCLNQTLPCYEIILVDDCSTNNIMNIILPHVHDMRRKNISFLYQRNSINRGVSHTRNVGWNRAKGDYVCFLDSDDIWHVDKLAIVDNILRLKKYQFICHNYTDSLVFKSENINRRIKKINGLSILVKNPAQTSCFVLERTIKERFNEQMRYSEDYDLWLRLSNKYQLYRIEGGALTKLTRPESSLGGLSGSRYKMRLGEIRAYYNYSFGYRFILFPILLIFSIMKHFNSEVRYATKRERISE